ncbi:LysR family transcriptional regulator [Kaustia mangrovi]|uniref:LysR family transcriptional regulator n=1 Tax=Kaustia mangrovi TaxID=2593653 RepID=A0A7S8C6N5_9HYPH|nr:LysR family transcriptional regulator [Kaustia mangrovi]QPC44349.1 LysR family transcriptional regulator [Kaustia mangrovi]
MLDRVTSMQVFVRVVSQGSFSAAGRALGLSQTMVTKHVASLEDRLGVKLLHRSTRRLTLTEAGRRYLAACERILADIDEAEALAAADRLAPRGTLRLNVPVSFGVRQIAPALPAFQAQYPDVAVDLGLNDRTVDLIEEGWDLAIRVGELADSSLTVRKLASCRLVVCAAPAYLARHGTPETVADLKNHNCLIYTLARERGGARWSFGPGGEIAADVGGNLRAGNGDAVMAAAIAGQGLIYQPTFIVADALRSGALVTVPLDRAPTDRFAVYALHPSDRRPPAKVAACVEFLASRFGGTPPWEEGLDRLS